jgi:glucans biosynthesis protein C
MSKLKIMTGKIEFKSDSPVSNSSERQYYLDWLRFFAILFVFFLHCGKIFDYQTTVLFNAVRSPVLSIIREFILLWVMPFIFVVSGAAVFLSFRFQKTGGFIKSKFRRLLIPSILIGTFVINPPYVYMEKLFSGKTNSGFFQWYPQFFDGIYVVGGNFAPWGMGTHIWYLQFLFIYSLILLPLFIRSKKSGVSLLERLSSYFENPWALFFFFLPISAVAAGFEAIGISGIRIMGNWDPISYIFFFVYGYLIFSNTKIQETIKRGYPIYLVVALTITILHLASHFGIFIKIQGVTGHDLSTGAFLPLDHSGFAVVQAFRGLAAWCWILAILGLGHRFLNFNNKLLVYSNEAVLPFYILHHPVLYITGFYVIQWGIGIEYKFIIISVVSFAGIMAIYEVLVKRMNIFRILFGMKTKKY